MYKTVVLLNIFVETEIQNSLVNRKSKRTFRSNVLTEYERENHTVNS